MTTFRRLSSPIQASSSGDLAGIGPDGKKTNSIITEKRI